MNAEILTLCDFANLDSGGKFNIIGGRHRLYAAGVPHTLENQFIAARLLFQAQEEGEKEVEISVITADGRPSMAPIKWNVNFECSGRELTGFMPMAFSIGQIVLPEFGEYDLVLKVGLDFQSRARIHVIRLESAPPL